MKVALGCDKNGLEYKNRIIAHLKKNNIEVFDCGTKEYIPCDSPYYANAVGKLVANKDCDYGVLICATGTGISIAANKVKGIFCGVGYSDEVTRLMREHNDANVIAFGQDHMGYKDVEKRVDIFLSTPFSQLKHQAARIQQIKDLEEGRDIELTPILNPDWNKEI